MFFKVVRKLDKNLTVGRERLDVHKHMVFILIWSLKTSWKAFLPCSIPILTVKVFHDTIPLMLESWENIRHLYLKIDSTCIFTLVFWGIDKTLGSLSCIRQFPKSVLDVAPNNNFLYAATNYKMHYEWVFL